MSIPLPKRPKVRNCTHIKATGQRCGSPAMRREFFCYFHTRVIKGVQHRVDMQLSSMALIEDSSAIQFSIMLVIDGLLKGTLEPLRARLILQGLRLAARNERYTRFNPTSEGYKETMVREVPNYARQFLIEHPEYGPPLSDPCGKASRCGADIPVREVETNTTSSDAGAPAREAATETAVQIEARAEPESSQQNDRHETTPTAPEPAAKRRNNAAHGASRGTETQTNPAPKERKKPSTPEHQTTKQDERTQRAQAAIPGALAGNWRDLKTVFEFAGITKQIKEAT
jgi:hypothetical protein